MARGVSQAADIGKQLLSARNIEFAAGQHEIGLGVDFPQNDVVAHSVGLVNGRLARACGKFKAS